jgi:hypothetical protein
MKPKKPVDRIAREQVEQLEITFPGLLALVEAKTMDNAIYPSKKAASTALAETNPETLIVTKGNARGRTDPEESMNRPRNPVCLVKKVAQAFKAVGKLQRLGTNTDRGFKYTRAPDVLEAVRLELFDRDVLILPVESKPEWVTIATTNGGEQLTACRLSVTYTFKDDKEELPPITVNGAAQNVDSAYALYAAQTGAQKALLKRFGLMAEEIEDPEWDGTEADMPAGESDVRSEQKPVTSRQRHAFAEACAKSGKTEQEILTYLFKEQGVSNIADLKRGKPFTRAIQWASTPSGTACKETLTAESPRPKPQAAPPFQASLPLPKAAPSFEMRVGGKVETVEPKTGSYAL